MVGEGDGSVQVCTELMSGEIPVELGMVSLAVMANLANSSGIHKPACIILFLT